MSHPSKYYRNNVAGTLALLDVMRRRGVNRIVFSSTSAVYGEPRYLPMDEEHPQNPTTPYGMSKLFVERILDSFDAAYGMKHVALRYFNACGATPTRGEDHCPEIHLIPLVLFTALGRCPYIGIYGTDYPTQDGTCVRDYVHVSDLARAHMLALEYLERGRASQKINLGNAEGFSVRQIIGVAEEVTGRRIPVREEPCRPGDPSRTAAAIEKAKEILDWSPEYTDIREIIRTAWEWHRMHVV